MAPAAVRAGTEQEVLITGIPAYAVREPASTSFGHGVLVKAIDALDDDTLRARIMVSPSAPTGPRSMTLRGHPDGGGDAIEVALNVLSADLNSRRGLISRLVYDRHGSFLGIRMDERSDLLRAPRELERILKETFLARVDVTPIIDPTTGELAGVEGRMTSTAARAGHVRQARWHGGAPRRPSPPEPKPGLCCSL